MGVERNDLVAEGMGGFGREGWKWLFDLLPEETIKVMMLWSGVEYGVVEEGLGQKILSNLDDYGRLVFDGLAGVEIDQGDWELMMEELWSHYYGEDV